MAKKLAGQMLKRGSESEAVWAFEAGTTQLVKGFNAQLMSPSVEDSFSFEGRDTSALQSAVHIGNMTEFQLSFLSGVFSDSTGPERPICFSGSLKQEIRQPAHFRYIDWGINGIEPCRLVWCRQEGQCSSTACGCNISIDRELGWKNRSLKEIN